MMLYIHAKRDQCLLDRTQTVEEGVRFSAEC